jgi:HTH-type transcriptional regulator / antitoxin HigA
MFFGSAITLPPGQDSKGRRKIMKAKTRRSRRIPATYFQLVAEFPLVSIKSEKQFHAAQAMIDGLLIKGKLDSGEETYLDALSDLLAAYEDVHYPIAPANDAEMLKFLMDAKGVDKGTLQRQSGVPGSTIGEILAGKKSLTPSLVRILSDYFQVNPSVLASN